MIPDGYKLITAIVPVGTALPVMKKLREEKNLISANVHHARGVGHIMSARRRLGDQSERDVLTVAVTSEMADEVFEFVYFEAGIDRPHGGIVFMSKLATATRYRLPEAPDEH